MPVLIRYTWKQRCFKVLFFHDSISQDVAAYVAILRESVEAYSCRLVGSLCILLKIIEGPMPSIITLMRYV